MAAGGFTTYGPGQQRAQLTGWVEKDRIPRVKIKIAEPRGTELTRDLERLSAARATIGSTTELYADASGAYTPTRAGWLMDAASELDVWWLEEPVSSDDLSGLCHARQTVRAEVAAGEYGCDLTYFRRMRAPEAVDCLQADATRCSGITEWLRVSALAAAHHLHLSAHCAPHPQAHAATTIPNLPHLEWFHDHVCMETMLFEGTLDPAGGVMRRSTRPGLGLAPREDVLASPRVGEPVTRRGSTHSAVRS